MRYSQLLILLTASFAALPLSASREVPTMFSESEEFRESQLAAVRLQPGEKLAQYTKYNFGPLWKQTPSTAVVGFIGAGYQRLQVKILTVNQSTTDPALYYVAGKTRVLGTVRSFGGTLRLQQVREAKPVKHRDMEEGPAPDVTMEGLAVGSYELMENKKLDRTGVFRGVVATNWYLDSKGQLHYNDLDMVADSYSNNRFVGTWTSYLTKKSLRCNWGDYRVPNSGDLDIGAGEFSPAKKYEANGWHTYIAALADPENTAARQQEKQAWWK